jgi:hypothetical protein
LIVCAIALRTSQLGFIPANLFCICIYAFSMRSWLKEQTHTHRDQGQPQDSGSKRWHAERAHSHTGASHAVYVAHLKEVADVIRSAAGAVSR